MHAIRSEPSGDAPARVPCRTVTRHMALPSFTLLIDVMMSRLPSDEDGAADGTPSPLIPHARFLVTGRGGGVAGQGHPPSSTSVAHRAAGGLGGADRRRGGHGGRPGARSRGALHPGPVRRPLGPGRDRHTHAVRRGNTRCADRGRPRREEGETGADRPGARQADTGVLTPSQAGSREERTGDRPVADPGAADDGTRAGSPRNTGGALRVSEDIGARLPHTRSGP